MAATNLDSYLYDLATSNCYSSGVKPVTFQGCYLDFHLVKFLELALCATDGDSRFVSLRSAILWNRTYAGVQSIWYRISTVDVVQFI